MFYISKGTKMIHCRDGTPETSSHWNWDEEKMGKPILTVDFHHTITDYCPACDSDFDPRQQKVVNGNPQEGVKEALDILKEKFKIVIYTGSGSFWDKNKLQSITQFLDKHEIPYDEINTSKPPAMFIIDDRAIHHTSWSDSIIEIERRLSSQ
jgi:hypothetical protein